VLCLAAYGFGDAIVEILRFALLQHHTPDRLRGRVSSLWHAQVTTGVAVGGVAAGLGAKAWAPQTVLLVHGIAGTVVVSLCALLLPGMRTARLSDEDDETAGAAEPSPEPV
jgi:ENTS family enterobactin (siderophore) exporter